MRGGRCLLEVPLLVVTRLQPLLLAVLVVVSLVVLLVVLTHPQQQQQGMVLLLLVPTGSRVLARQQQPPSASGSSATCSNTGALCTAVAVLPVVVVVQEATTGLRLAGLHMIGGSALLLVDVLGIKFEPCGTQLLCGHTARFDPVVAGCSTGRQLVAPAAVPNTAALFPLFLTLSAQVVAAGSCQPPAPPL